MMPIMFLSGPISNGDTLRQDDILTNVINAEKIMFNLMDKGYSVYCPHLYFNAVQRHNKTDVYGWKHWTMTDYAFLEKSDALFYMIPEVYGASKGAAAEVAKAKELGLPVYEWLGDVPDRRGEII